MRDGVADLREVLGRLGIAAPTSAVHDLGSYGRTHVFIVGDIVVKCDDRFGSNSMVRERCALELLAGTDLPVPTVVASGEFDDTRRWIVVSRLDGEAPPDAARPAHELSTDLAGQLGTIIARLHAVVRPPGFGTWEHGHHKTFVEEEQGRVDALARLAREDEIVPPSELGEVLRITSKTIDAIESWKTPVLAHRDVQPRNVLVVDGKITALLDFESSSGGDPAEDFRVIGLDWSSPAFAAFRDSYAASGGSLGVAGAERLIHHVAVWALVVFAYLGKIAPVYLEPARTALARVSAGERPPIDVLLR